MNMKKRMTSCADLTKGKNKSLEIRIIVGFFTFALLVLGINFVFEGSDHVKAASPLQIKSGDKLWQDVDEKLIGNGGQRPIIPDRYRTVRLNRESLQQFLKAVPLEFTDAARAASVELSLPMPYGGYQRFAIVDSPIMEPKLAAQYPEFNTYRGQGLDDPTATLRFDVTPAGFHAIVLTTEGSVYIDPYAKSDIDNYISYYGRDDKKSRQPFQCFTSEREMQPSAAPNQTLNVSTGQSLRSFRLAVGATVEYTQLAGGTVNSALTLIMTTINRVDAIFERDLAVRLILVNNESNIIFTTLTGDQYTNGNAGVMFEENQAIVDAGIGPANYDVGHVFGTGGGTGGGIAYRPSACFDVDPTYGVRTKAKGASITVYPTADAFAVGIVSHEIGHQFGASHNFNGTSGGCQLNRAPQSAYEPGAGSTIMCYVYSCDPQNLDENSGAQTHRDDYFHIANLEQMNNNINELMTCPTLTNTNNSPPSVNAGPGYAIPRATPFTLTATGSDPNGDSLTYAWEEYDLGAGSPPDTDADGVARPIFRSYAPTTSPSRTFPALQYIRDNANVPPAFYRPNNVTLVPGEALPTMDRTMNFQVTARDNRSGGGGVSSSQTQIVVTDTSGPFFVVDPNTAITWAPGSQQTVTWNVANTTASPVSCTNVKISLSTDGGNTFPFVLAANTANDGSELITLPNVATTTARVKVEAIGNIFFDMSDVDFAIASCAYTISPTVRNPNAGSTMKTVAVLPVGGCNVSWQAKSNVYWITITSGGSGTGSGTVSYSVQNNPGSERTGTITVAGNIHTVTQSGLSCSFTLNPVSQVFDAAGNIGSVTVTNNCPWYANSNVPWIEIISGSNGMVNAAGNGKVLYAVAANTSTSQRMGTLRIADSTFTVTQLGAVPPSGNYSIALNGVDSYMNVPNSSSLNITGSLTVEAWIKSNNVGLAQQSIVERYNTFGVNTTDGGYALRLSGNKLQFFVLKNGNVFDMVESSTTINAGTWYHVAGVYDSSTTLLRLYIDGVSSVTPKASAYAPGSGTASTKIGARGDDAGIKFNGLIDEVRVTAAAVYASNFQRQAHLAEVVGTRGLWKFDNHDANDTTANHNNGTLIGNATFSTDVPTDGGPATYYSIALNGVDSYMNVANSSSLNITGSLTVEAWIKSNNVGLAQQSIVERYNTFGVNTTDGGYALRLSGNKLQFFVLKNGNVFDMVESSTTINAGTWYHVAGVYDSSTTLLRLYIDGVSSVTPKASAYAPGSGTASTKIGARGDDAGIKFNGLIDEVRVTAAAVYASNFQRQAHLAEVVGTRGLWKFDNHDANDTTANHNNGTLIGNATFSTDVPQ
jgi:Concanavalin A-like lectin/glucanases superfamily/Metallo-peptidase family M12B Reprolysin-like/Putative binding domain, N-terminal/Viral BACON domain